MFSPRCEQTPAQSRNSAPLAQTTGSGLEHRRVAELDGRDEGLFDGPGAQPALQVQGAPGFVVRSGPARAAERLLPDDRARRLVVHVEVAGSVAEPRRRVLQEPPVAA